MLAWRPQIAKHAKVPTTPGKLTSRKQITPEIRTYCTLAPNVAVGSIHSSGSPKTAQGAGLFAHGVLGMALKEALLLGAIVSSTDAAAVFSVLRSRNIHLPGRLRSLLELESGSNDPMAVFLTVAMITLIQNPSMSPAELLPMFIRQMSLGAAFGYGMGVVLRVAVKPAASRLSRALSRTDAGAGAP